MGCICSNEEEGPINQLQGNLVLPFAALLLTLYLPAALIHIHSLIYHAILCACSLVDQSHFTMMKVVGKGGFGKVN
jgi:hypothetical protein